ncbi:hypothetical protein TNCV_1391251 [Trichonephila clavipes]|nr:hypothetical protein TNCV_1391251 [Trichonephila clavipes]
MLLPTAFAILNLGEETRTTPRTAPHSPNFHTSPTGEFSAATDLTRINFSTHYSLSRKQDEAPIWAEALGPGPVGLGLRTGVSNPNVLAGRFGKTL